jgi:hypothetical protein
MNGCAIELCVLVMTVLSACGDDDAAPLIDGGATLDLGAPDLGSADLGPDDMGSSDLGSPDLGAPTDAGPRCAPTPSGDTRWAQYPMPGTSGHARSYQITGIAGSETVIDCVTGLEWQRAVDPASYTQADAVAYCNGLTLAGYTDWRLPSRIELVTLVDYLVASPGPTIDTTAFPGTPGAGFGSASSVASSPSDMWSVYFYGGIVSYNAVTYSYRARCVRGNDAVGVSPGVPAGHFTDVGDGTVRDNLTGLVWQQGFSPSGQSQAASATYCSTLTVPSGGGWRLPTVAELQTLVDETAASPSIASAYFPSTVEEVFWSSSSVAGAPSDGWDVDFYGGIAGSFSVAATYRARCVR